MVAAGVYMLCRVFFLFTSRRMAPFADLPGDLRARRHRLDRRFHRACSPR
jgi:hypothetical protein